MPPYADLLPSLTPTNAEERIRSIVSSGRQFIEYERLPNGDVLGAVRAPDPWDRAGWTHWTDCLVPADGAKARLL